MEQDGSKIIPKKMLYGINMLKHVIKKGGKAGGELKPEDLDENILRSRLLRIEEELVEYRKKCLRYKHENEWFRQEIEECQKDTTEYINYLELKNTEKIDLISSLNDANRQDLETFNQRKLNKQKENDLKILETINNLEEKIQSKQLEMLKLSDVMGRRARHDAEISKIRKEIQIAEADHQLKVSQIEKSLIESRYKIQKEADQKIKVMQSEAHDRAYNYLNEHTQSLDEQNKVLETELSLLISKTQEQLNRRQQLEKENSELEREEKLRGDLIRIRLERIQKAQIKNDLLDEHKRRKRLENRKTQMETLFKNRSQEKDGIISDGLDPLDLHWSDDDFSDE